MRGVGQEAFWLFFCLGVQIFFPGLQSFSWVWHSMITAWGLTMNQWWQKLYRLYSLFGIFIIIIVVVIIIISVIISNSIYILALLNCLYLNPWVYPFAHFSSASHWGGGGGVCKQLSSALLPAAGLNCDSGVCLFIRNISQSTYRTFTSGAWRVLYLYEHIVKMKHEVFQHSMV